MTENTDDRPLAGRVALVAGATRGPGRAIAIELDAAGGRGVAVRVDHTRSEQVEALVRRIAEQQDGRLDVLVNDIWGGDPLTQWCPFWEHDLANGLERSGVTRAKREVMPELET